MALYRRSLLARKSKRREGRFAADSSSGAKVGGEKRGFAVIFVLVKEDACLLKPRSLDEHQQEPHLLGDGRGLEVTRKSLENGRRVQIV